MLFLVVGHTENVCDRCFNNLKNDYNKRNVYTLDQAVEVLGESEYVTAWPIDTTSDWLDYYSMLLKPYKMMKKAGLHITTNHIFSATVEIRNTLKFFTGVSNFAQHPPVFALILNLSFTAGGDGNRKELL
jgi:hypothetical protein